MAELRGRSMAPLENIGESWLASGDNLQLAIAAGRAVASLARWRCHDNLRAAPDAAVSSTTVRVELVRRRLARRAVSGWIKST